MTKPFDMPALSAALATAFALPPVRAIVARVGDHPLVLGTIVMVESVDHGVARVCVAKHAVAHVPVSCLDPAPPAAPVRLTEKEKRRVVCVKCLASIGKPCRGSRQPGANTFGGGWGGPPDLDRSHDERRKSALAFFASGGAR